MKVYDLHSRYVQAPEREAETRFGGKTIRVFRNVRAVPLREYVLAVDDEVLLDTAGSPAVFEGVTVAVGTAKARLRELAAGRTPPLPEAPPPPEPPGARRPLRPRRPLGRRRGGR
jgi:hypothetical protein